MRFWLLQMFIAALVQSSSVHAQSTEGFDPAGYWTGAIIKDGSVLPVEVEIVLSENAYLATTTFPDWYFSEPSGPATVRQTTDGLIIKNLLAGDAIVELEPKFEQLTGTVGDDGRRIHLKRAPTPPKPLVVSTVTEFTSGDGTRISATLTLPAFGGQVAGMVLVGGRGCASRSNGKAGFFAQYGIAVLTYDQRGAGKSEGDCASHTFDELTDDAIAALDHLAAHPRVDAKRVGFLGESAGAWTIQAATERQRKKPEGTQPAFLVTWIGPATSIIQQQISSAATYGNAVGLSEDQQAVLAEVSRIIVDKSLSDDAAFAKLDAIRRAAEAEGWLEQGFGADDIPRTRADISKLWLRRFAYDPTPFLQVLGDLPYLAVFGAKDPIVPVDENIAALQATGTEVEISVLKESGHGHAYGQRSLELPSGRPFWLFEGIDSGFANETINFLRNRGFVVR